MKEVIMMLGTFPKTFSQPTTSQGYFPKGIFPSDNFLRVFSHVATSQLCNFPSDNLYKYQMYRVSHIILDRQGLYENFLPENAKFFGYYVFILALKLGDNLIWYGTLCIIRLDILWMRFNISKDDLYSSNGHSKSSYDVTAYFKE